VLSGLVVLREPPQRLGRRLKREIKRVGWRRFTDVLAFRLYYRLALAAHDRAWAERALEQLRDEYPPLPADLPVLDTSSPNTPEAEAFIRNAAPDIVIARCKSLLKQQVFSIPARGTFVLHPGICPEYRNAHGCFWALANGDVEKVGATLLKIDEGVDTGPVHGYYTYPFDPHRESHVVIQQRVVLENLPAIRCQLEAIARGTARPLDTAGRRSQTWGQPWLSRYLRYRRRRPT
jgi:methionyl-tRNA formyltransferase